LVLFIKILLNNILPTFLVMGVGVLLDRKLQIDKRSLARMGLYVLVPCLVFSSTVQSSVDPRQFGLIILYGVVLTLLLCALAYGVGRALRWPPRLVDALVLSVAFVNAGNFGLPVILFAFGDQGLELGTVFFVASNFVGNTVAAFFAARANHGGKAFLQVLKLPGPYAFALAFLLRATHIQVPDPLLKSVTLIGSASVPMMLMMLGLQLSQTQVGKRYSQVAVGVFLRLVVGALLAVGLAPVVGLQGLARSVAITQASTPTAVTSALMAIEFEADAEYVTSVVFFSTLFSAVTLTVLLALLH
jgi:malate permease and related proteins